MSSRSEIKVLLEELSTYKSGEEPKEEFPDLLLSSLDKLYNDKQQQLWLVYDDKEIKSNYIILLICLQISGIHNSIEKSKSKKCTSNKSISEWSSESDAKNVLCDDKTCDISEAKAQSSWVPTMTHEAVEGKEANGSCRKNVSSLKLDLSKAYEFTPPSPSWNNRYSFGIHLQYRIYLFIFRPGTAPSSKFQSWTPTTPTPCSSLRPSLSLHNLESKTFTDILIPTIKPPPTIQIIPSSKRSPLVISPVPRAPKKISVVVFGSDIKPNDSRFERKSSQASRSQKISESPSPASPSLHSYISLPSLTEISESSFLACKKEISV